MYNIALDLSPEQKHALKVLAATTGTTVRGLVTKLVVDKLNEKKEEDAKSKTK